MEPKDAAVVSEALGVEPFVACASDFGWISRPRLWWMSPAVTTLSLDPAEGRQLQWGKQGSFRRLRLESARAPSEDMQADGLFFHEAVTSGRLRLPRATAPAEDEQGRPAPKRVRQKLPEPAKARWAADGRRFAPWHYVEEAMMHDAAGRLHIIPPAAKEKLHMLPPGYTAADFLDDRARHKMLANGWHWGVARRLLAMLVVLTAAGPAQAAPAPEPRRSTMQWMVEQFGGGPVPMEPPPRLRPDLELPDDDRDMHWHLAGQLVHCTVARRPNLEPALERVLELWTRWRHEVTRLRREVLVELAQLVLDMQETTDEWLASRSAPVRSTYTVPGKARHTQIPVVLNLLEMVGYPDVAGITADLTDGFDMLGELRRGPGWKSTRRRSTPWRR
ncbi:eIF3-S7 [Symbiodinium necroappetens]|uniref:eIF3-S7 protein n=1 Tax=Symbiodinium necroappetens TaxID=1628268 RepID=A0A813C0V5_9DINO|nr:eIF3-S7 [Symbiodinium necroappetens]